MQVLSVNLFNKNTYTQEKKTSHVSFYHHPDFIALNRKSCPIISSYFRRGAHYGTPSKNFIHVINTLKLFFNKNVNTEKVKILIGGIAESQEPFSILAVIQNLTDPNKLEDVLDLNIVDLQSKPDKKKLRAQSFYDMPFRPDYVPNSFVYDNNNIKYCKDCNKYNKYRVKNEIFKYLFDVYNNPEKARWETRIQEAIKEYPDNYFDVISVNNTLGYILDFNLMMKTVQNIYNKLKSNGVFITDPHMTEYQEVFSPDVCDEIYPGIYKRNDSKKYFYGFYNKIKEK